MLILIMQIIEIVKTEWHVYSFLDRNSVSKNHFLVSSNFRASVSEAVAQRCSVKKVFLEISQNLQENTCARVFYRTHLVAAWLIINNVRYSGWFSPKRLYQV